MKSWTIIVLITLMIGGIAWGQATVQKELIGKYPVLSIIDALGWQYNGGIGSGLLLQDVVTGVDFVLDVNPTTGICIVEAPDGFTYELKKMNKGQFLSVWRRVL